MIPRFTVLVDNVNLNSLGFPAFTTTFVAVTAPERAMATAPATPEAARHTAAIGKILVNRLPFVSGIRPKHARW
jgi:hypothetical protein